MKCNYGIALFSGRDRAEIEAEMAAVSQGSAVRKYSPHEQCRAFAVYESRSELKQLMSEGNAPYPDISEHTVPGETVMLFPGSGIHQKKMLTLLCSSDAWIKEKLTELAGISAEYYDIPLLDEDREDEIINNLRVFASELVLAQYWEHIGCRADHVIGHSMGEYAAAVFCGIIAPDDAVYMLTERCRAIKETVPHQMAAVETSAENVCALAQRHGLGTFISAYNGPEIVTVCGTKREMAVLNSACREMNYRCSLINSLHGGHYPGLSESAVEFAEKINGITFCEPDKHFISTVYPDGEKRPQEASYWADHIVRPVQFMQAVRKLDYSKTGRVIDVGVSPVLISMAMKNVGNIGAAWIPTVRSGRNYEKQILRAVGLAFNSGVNIDEEKLAKNKKGQGDV